MLAGSAAYALAEAFGWLSTLEARFLEARGFYIIILAATAIRLWTGIYLFGSDQDAGVERRIERGRFSSRYGHHDGAYHQFFGDGAIPRSPLAGLGGMGSDGFDGTTGYRR